jgi:hypothetical protein
VTVSPRHRGNPGNSRHPGHNDEGFGLIDALVAFTVLLVVLVPMVYLMSEVGQQTSANRFGVTADQLAEQALENVGSLPLHGTTGLLTVLSGGGTITTAPVVNGEQYNSTVQLSWSTIGSTRNLCTAGSPPQVILATAVVSWRGGSVTDNTAINPPYGALVSTDGFVPVEVTGASNQPMSGINVTVNDITNPGTPSTFTTENGTGCSFMQLPAGDKYSFTLGPPTGYPATSAPYVSNGEALNPTTSMTSAVGANGTVSPLISFSYDISGSIGLTPPSVTAVDGGVMCPTIATCFAMGQSAASATLFASSATSGGWTNVPMPSSNAPTLLSSVACPSASQCYFAGSNTTVVNGANVPGGLIESATLSGSTWTLSNSTLTASPGLTASALTSLSCPSTTVCFASGSGVSGSTQEGVIAALSDTSWTLASPTVSPATTTVSSLPSIACPTATLCLAIGPGLDSTVGTPTSTVFNYTVATSVLTVANPIISGSAVASASSATCPTAPSPTCFVVGSSVISPATTSVPVLFVSANGGTTWTQTVLTGALSVGQLTCTSSSLCLVPATMSSGGNGAGDTNNIFRLTFTAGSSPAAWTAATQTTPTSFTGSIAGIACTSATACITAGQSSTSGFIDSSVGTATTVGAIWSPVTLTGAQTPGYFSGVACAGNGTYCVASGEGPSGDLLDSSTNSGTAWSASPSSLFTPNGGGQSASGLPLSYTLPGLSVVNTPASGQLGSLYPFPTAYTVFYGDCTDEESVVSTATPTVSSSAQTQTSIGLGTLALQIVDENGQAISGAKVSVVTTDTKCPTHVFSLPSTGASGVSQAGVLNTPTSSPYTLTVTSGAHAFPVTTLAVSGSGVVATTGGVTTIYHYPNPVIIKALS